MSYIGVSAAPTPAGVYTKAETETRLNDKLSTEGGELTGGLTVTPLVGESFVKLKSNTEGATSEVMLRGSDNDGFDTAYNSTLDQFRISRYVSDVYQNSPVIVDANGNVGVGTSSPAQKLQVNDATAAQALFTGWSQTGANTTSGAIRLGGNSAYQGRIDYAADANTTFTFENTYSSGIFNWKIANTERMRIDSAGRVTMPYQPAFEAGFSGVTTLSDGSVCVFDWTGFNRGGHYSTSNGRFTVPITGVYQFQYSNNIQRGSGSTWTGFDFRINGSTYHICFADASTSWMNMSLSVLLNLQAGDYVTVVSRGSGSLSHDSKSYGTFTGQLIG